MTIQHWMAGKGELKPEVPDAPPEHLLKELLEVIELWRNSYPTIEHCKAMQRLADAIREET